MFPMVFSSSAQPLRAVKALLGLERLGRVLEVTKGGHLVPCFRSQLWDGGTSAPMDPSSRCACTAGAGVMPLLLSCRQSEPARSAPLSPRPVPLPMGAVFPSAQSRQCLGGCAGRLQAPSGAARGAACVSGAACQEHHLGRGAGGYRLALRPARDSGISSGMARLGQALFWGSRCLGFLMSSPRDRDDQLGALSGIDLAGKPSSLAGLGEPGLGWDLLPQEPGLCCTLSCAGFSFPFAPWRGLGSFPTQVEVEGCRQGWRDSFCHSQPPPDRAFPH